MNLTKNDKSKQLRIRKKENLRKNLKKISFSVPPFSYYHTFCFILQLIYDLGVSFRVIMWVWTSMACMVFLNCFLNWPGEFFPAPEDIKYTQVQNFSLISCGSLHADTSFPYLCEAMTNSNIGVIHSYLNYISSYISIDTSNCIEPCNI